MSQKRKWKMDQAVLIKFGRDIWARFEKYLGGIVGRLFLGHEKREILAGDFGGILMT